MIFKDGAMDQKAVYDVIRMLKDEHLDIRTTTLGISLLDCGEKDAKKTAENIYEKICRTAERLVPATEKISKTLGVDIVHKRIAVTPIAMIGRSEKPEDFVLLGKALDRAASAVGVNFIGGYSALVQDAMTPQDRALMESIPEALSETNLVCSSVNVGSSKAGINMDAVSQMGEIIKETAEKTGDQDGLGAAKLVVFCNAVEDNPFMAGAFHGPSQGDTAIKVGVSGPGVVLSALKKMKRQSIQDLAEEIKKTAFQITRLGELVGKRTAEELGIDFTTIDLSLAPTPAVGDSVARILEEMGLSVVGTHGTTACLALLNDAVKKGGLMASSYVGGLSGAFIPVSEDEGMIAAAKSGDLCMDKLEAMTSVCSVGLDMIAIPGKTPASTISAIIADEAAIGMINGKTTAVRVIPVPGKDVGDTANFGGLLGYAPILPVHEGSSEALIRRGGFIPAPVHSFKN